ncbi:hypothetical protein [Haloflavibacter putidus]|uniref:Outer membrane protein beta-barrel domain-containing protein n=1 Tax=Haloflavibacter putidus TaxID=2576776 RepID=A0A507ZNT0_9FLAO|nr:hypothetical protein [Haloflavibacter putidus]TQD38647.1 hypothetical protein FKR84_08335 [Haloflavibacter putidus]
MYKKILLLVILVVALQNLNAQFSKNHTIYATTAANFGNYLGADLNLNYVYKEKYSVKLGYTPNIREADNTPADYTGGLTDLLFFEFFKPYDELHSFNLSVGRIYKLNKKGSIRLNLSAGIGVVHLKEPTNWQPVEDPDFLGNNYTYDFKEYNTFNFVFNPKIEFPFTRYYGVSLSPMVQINKDRVYFGIGIGQMFGVLRSKKQ